jgi:hypothetical protein
VVRGSVFGTGGELEAVWHILVVYVPFGLVTYYLIFLLLATRSQEYATLAQD